MEHRVGDELKVEDDGIRLVEERVHPRRDLKKYGNFKDEGIEACIGNTPLFKIKSLSEETGCEILAKAEVRSSRTFARVLRELSKRCSSFSMGVVVAPKIV